MAVTFLVDFERLLWIISWCSCYWTISRQVFYPYYGLVAPSAFCRPSSDWKKEILAPRAGLKPMQPMQPHWAPHHGVR